MHSAAIFTARQRSMQSAVLTMIDSV